MAAGYREPGAGGWLLGSELFATSLLIAKG